MNKAQLYNISNIITRRDALECLEEYGKQIKWKNGRITVLDIGCGDGSVTMSILKKHIPNKCKRLVGCDISENMIQFANEKYANDHTSFIVQNIQGYLPKELRGTFDHVFSFYTLHWIQNQELAFTNIYDLLSEGGECFLLFLAHTPVFDVYRVLARTTKWKFYLKDAERYISPYIDCPDLEKKVKEMMISIGFTSVEVECFKKTYVYPNLDLLKGVISSISPFKIPNDLEEDYLQDYFDVLRDMKIIDSASSNDDEPIKATFNYRLIVAKGRK